MLVSREHLWLEKMCISSEAHTADCWVTFIPFIKLEPFYCLLVALVVNGIFRKIVSGNEVS